MKSVAVVFFIPLLFFLACSTMPVAQPPSQQEILIKIKGVDTVKIEEEVAGDGVMRSMEVANPNGKLSHLSFIVGGEAFVKIFAGISVSDVNNIWSDLCYLEHETDVRKINLFINSPGGDAFSGLALSDEIERAKKKGFTVTAYASGIVASAAVPIFAVCTVRIASPGTIFMVHEAALWKWPGRETASDIRSQNNLMDLLRSRYITKMVEHSKLSKAQWEALEHKTTWFNAQTAMDEYGIVDKIE